MTESVERRIATRLLGVGLRQTVRVSSLWPRLRAQVQDTWSQLVNGIPLRYDADQPAERVLERVGSALAHGGAPQGATAKVKGRVSGAALRLTPRSQMYSWQPVFRGVVEARECGSSSIRGAGTWSWPTRVFTVLFPLIGSVFVLVALTVGSVALLQGRTSFGSVLAAAGFGVVFGGGSLAMSVAGARDAREDMASLEVWMRWVLADDESGPSGR